MGVFAGVDGVVREMSYIDAGRAGVHHIPEGWAGVDGVTRQFFAVSEIDHIEIDVNAVTTFTCDADRNIQSTDGYDLATANQYGTITISSTQIQVTCTTKYKWIEIGYTVNVVFKDGHSTTLYKLCSATSAIFALSVTGYQYFSNDGGYINYCLGNVVLEDYVSGSTSATKTLSTATASFGQLAAIMQSSGTCRSRQTFNSIQINGTQYDIVIVNNLT